jgi:DNA-binding response OmpR family regulator
MAEVLVLTASTEVASDVLPGIALLHHRVRCLLPEPSALIDVIDADIVLLDARSDLVGSRATCKLVRATGISVPLVLVLTEGGMAVVTSDWGADDVILVSAPPAEIETRFRLALGRTGAEDPLAKASEFTSGDLTVDVGGYTARLKGAPLDLTFKEFELLKYLMQHPGRVYTRDQLLQEVWGFDYYGGTRTVDVHVRRLRAKLGAEHDQMIGTVRNVGYRFDPLPAGQRVAVNAAEGTGDPSVS